MKKIFIDQLMIYESYHTQQITKVTHFIGVPALVFAAMIFFGWIHLSVPNIFSINLAWIGLVLLLIYYFYLDILLALGMAVILILMTIMAEFISQPIITKAGFIIFMIFLIVGIVAQLIGHLYEQKKPAFTENFKQILIAPIFLFAEVMFHLGYRQDLWNEISADKYK